MAAQPGPAGGGQLPGQGPLPGLADRAQHFVDLLVDADVANNTLNWQWVAGTGTDARPNRVFDPSRQAARHDPEGRYLRRWLPELGTPDYPLPIVDHRVAAAAFHAAEFHAARAP